MTSLIQYFKNKGLAFNAYSSSIYVGAPSNVFDNKYFSSNYNAPGQWWQVSFSQPVTITSYTFKCDPSYVDRPYSWKITSSMDNETWKDIETRTKDVGGNEEIFSLNKFASCKQFRITLRPGFVNFTKNIF